MSCLSEIASGLQPLELNIHPIEDWVNSAYGSEFRKWFLSFFDLKLLDHLG